MLSIALASAATLGPVIKDFGPVFEVNNAAPIPSDIKLKAVFDVTGAPDPGALSRKLESVARYLNMHARAGIKPEAMALAVVLHGSATRHALNDQAHLKRFEVEDGSATLLDALIHAGVKVYVCGQSYSAQGYGDNELRPDVQLALSAMTELTVLQQQGFSLLP
ncbi:DsrE family protein [Gallaecimonas xiamenensis]|uniref:Uncharacterized protein n=1 Tax=Gallaecimonas xiamenensis 3-C-1 TaxID=745411 RepID=K2J4D5_9GAMM|nr:DsrE family protein [Gallaecimonas xiamenensis]EKE77906.1 hypothetical protein B3C1_00560 [Gallaecimonas xiamenensis 3-C-1]